MQYSPYRPTPKPENRSLLDNVSVPGMPLPVLLSNRKLQNLNCIEQASKTQGAIYLGDIISVLKLNLLSENRIGAILSCLTQNNAFQPNPSTSHIEHKTIPMKDTLAYPIHIHFDESFAFIEQMRKQNRNVLVHCHAGVSRSATIVCAYLMKKNNWSMDQALGFIKGKRERVRPNQNFLALLAQYEQRLKPTAYNVSTPLTHRPHQMTQSRPQKNSPMYQSAFLSPQYQPTVNSMHQSNIFNKTDLHRHTFHVPAKLENTPSTKSKLTFSRFNKQTYPKNRISEKLGRRTRIPWELLEKSKIDQVKKKLFEEEQQTVQNTGCF